MRRILVSLLVCFVPLACTTTERVRVGGVEVDDTTDTTERPTRPSTTDAPTPVGSEAPAPTSTAPPTSAAPRPEAGTGDTLFPDLGTTAIDVQSYDVDFTFDPADRMLRARVVISLEATVDADEISLDSDGPVVDSLLVDGVEANHRQAGEKLVVTLPTPVRAGSNVVLEIDYHRDTTERAPRPGIGDSSVGWYNTPGGAYVLNEPNGTHRYLPSNDHPSDKALWTVTLRVPAGLQGIANGGLVSHDRTADGEVYLWREESPMATYLLQVLIGRYTIIEDQVPDGPALLSVVLTEREAELRPCLSSMPDMITRLERYFGPYPFGRYGMAISDSFSGLAMETQGRSLFSADDLFGCREGDHGSSVMAHELAHQWFGDAVTLARWDDIWLNESFATYGEWLEFYGSDVDRAAQDALRSRWGSATGRPTVESMFGSNVYEGGAVVLHALRRTVGDETFFDTLRAWVSENHGGSATTADFIALAERMSGRDLGDFFDTWLYAEDVPSSFP